MEIKIGFLTIKASGKKASYFSNRDWYICAGN